ncbi:hypothetical protein EXIGLDRAFT_147600 [Exidia glandulosa HHB12029]|uniref:Fungal N-terminal domain-containing protein n=1 Tax=Exidia glandulosa HHB12029 TaxID=1314781 RepID=A0A166A871_EXIGL|nr:hypothetical protein EXIGLDRAFT_147600 [Exidia glandulosa HHB12029]
MTTATLTLSSVGDIVAVVQLAWQLRQSLADAATASSEIQALVDDIDSFKRALESARVLLEETADVPQSVHNGVTHTMNVCAGLLRHAEAKILMRRKEMVSAHGWSSWRAVWSVCAWTILGGKADVEALKHRLAEQMLALQTLLNVLQRCVYNTVTSLHRRSDNEPLAHRCRKSTGERRRIVLLWPGY